MSETKLIGNSSDMSIGGHIDELRARIIRCVIFLLISATIFFIFKGSVLNVIFAPLEESFPTNKFFAWLSIITDVEAFKINTGNVTIINTKMAGQFNLHIKSSLIAAIIVSVPFILGQLWSFIKPAIPYETQLKTKYFVVQTSLWFFAGLLFGYFAIAPLTINFLTSYTVSTSITNMIDISSYLSNVMGVSFAAALVFQLPLIVKLLSTIGILHSSLMKKYRKIAFVIIIIVSAIITPPDVLSLILLAIPLYGLYEYGITIAVGIERKKALKASLNE